MNDDWRLRVEFQEHGILRSALGRLNASELQHAIETSFDDRVIVSAEGAELFCYGGTREQLEAAEALIRREAEQHGWQISTELRRWHPTAEQWEEPGRQLPQDDAARAAERAELMARERAESRDLGVPEYEVRVTCRTRTEASELADQLGAEGLPSVQRSNFLLIGALDEDSAQQIADRVRTQVPAETGVTAEASAGAVIAQTGGNPFALIGGLGG